METGTRDITASREKLGNWCCSYIQIHSPLSSTFLFAGRIAIKKGPYRMTPPRIQVASWQPHEGVVKSTLRGIWLVSSYIHVLSAKWFVGTKSGTVIHRYQWTVSLPDTLLHAALWASFHDARNSTTASERASPLNPFIIVNLQCFLFLQAFIT